LSCELDQASQGKEIDEWDATLEGREMIGEMRCWCKRSV